MAQLLVKTQQTGDGPGAYLRGHVVAVRPDSHVWGSLEGPPRFYILQVPDEALADHPELTLEEFDSGEEVLRRRKWTIDVDSFPPGILVALEQAGLAEVPRGVLNAAVQRETRLSLRGARRGD